APGGTPSPPASLGVYAAPRDRGGARRAPRAGGAWSRGSLGLRPGRAPRGVGACADAHREPRGVRARVRAARGVAGPGASEGGERRGVAASRPTALAAVSGPRPQRCDADGVGLDADRAVTA